MTLTIDRISRVPQMNSDGPSTAIAPSASTLPKEPAAAPLLVVSPSPTTTTATKAATSPPRASTDWAR